MANRLLQSVVGGGPGTGPDRFLVESRLEVFELIGQADHQEDRRTPPSEPKTIETHREDQDEVEPQQQYGIERRAVQWVLENR